MSGVKHTPGPWTVSVVNSVVCVQATDEIGQQFDICSMSNFDMEANARLIAAAPDLLEALADMKRVFGDPVTRRALGGHNERQQLAILSASSAIARARGKS